MRAGSLLAGIAVVLAVVGVAVVWITDTNVDDPGTVRSDAAASVCADPDLSMFDEWALAEESRVPGETESGGVPRHTCEVTLVAGEDTTDYVAVTLKADARVQETVKDAVDAYTGVTEYETSQGRTIEPLTAGDDAGLVVVISDVDKQQYHVHVRVSNALVSVSMAVTGSTIPADEARDAAIAFAASVVAVMGSE